MKLCIQGLLLIVVIGAISTSICLWVVPQNPEIVIVDIQKVYTELGEDIEFQKQMRRQESRLRQNLESLRIELGSSLALRTKQLGDNPSEEDKKILEAIKNDMQKQIDQQSAMLRSGVQSYKGKLLHEMRTKVKRVANQIAMKRGASVILLANQDLLLSCDASKSITEDVVAQMQKESSRR